MSGYYNQSNHRQDRPRGYDSHYGSRDRGYERNHYQDDYRGGGRSSDSRYNPIAGPPPRSNYGGNGGYGGHNRYGGNYSNSGHSGHGGYGGHGGHRGGYPPRGGYGGGGGYGSHRQSRNYDNYDDRNGGGGGGGYRNDSYGNRPFRGHGRGGGPRGRGYGGGRGGGGGRRDNRENRHTEPLSSELVEFFSNLSLDSKARGAFGASRGDTNSAPKPLKNVNLLFSKRLTVACNALPIVRSYPNLTKYKLDLVPEIEDPMLRSKLLNKPFAKRRLAMRVRPHFYDKMHIFSFKPSMSKSGEQDEKSSSTSDLVNDDIKIEGVRMGKGEEAHTIVLTKVKNCDAIPLTQDAMEQQVDSREFMESGLNVINRERFHNAKYQKFGRTDLYLSPADSNNYHEVQQRDPQLPDLVMFKGYKSTAHFAKGGIFVKTNIQHKPVCKGTLHDVIKTWGVDEAKRRFNTEDRSKQPYTCVKVYDYEFVRIELFDTSLNIDSTFKLRNKDDISYRQYFANKLGMNANEIKQEDGLIKFGRELIPPQFLYLVANNDIQTDEAKKMFRSSYSNLEPRRVIEEALHLNRNLQANSNKVTKIFDIDTNRATMVTAYELNDPIIKLVGGGGGKFEVPGSEMNGKLWGQMKGVIPPGWRMRANRTFARGNWCIIYNENVHSREANSVMGSYEFFMNRRRNFADPPLNAPVVKACNMSKMEDIRAFLRSNEIDVALFIIETGLAGSKMKIDMSRFVNFEHVPENRLTIEKQDNNYRDNPYSRRSDYSSDRNRRSTSYGTREVQSQFLANDGGTRDLDTQFITAQTAQNQSAVFNVVESIILKCGFILYEIDAKLPANKLPIYHGNMWAVGIVINKLKTETRRMNGVSLAVMQEPMLGGLVYIHSHTALMCEKEIIPHDLMHDLIIDMIDNGLSLVVKNRRKLPLNLLFLRTRVSDGAFAELVKQELNTIESVLLNIRRASRKSKDKVDEKIWNIVEKLRQIEGSGVVSWKPGIIFSVVQDNVIDTFDRANANVNANANGHSNSNSSSSSNGYGNGRNGYNGYNGYNGHNGYNGNRGRNNYNPKFKTPIVIADFVTSGVFLDFFLQTCKQQERDKYIHKTLRYVQLADKIKYRDGAYGRLSESTELMSDFIQFMWALHFACCENMPFVKGPPDYPAPIKFAEHYAEWQEHLITRGDTDPNQLKSDAKIQSAKPKMVIGDSPKKDKMERTSKTSGMEKDLDMKSNSNSGHSGQNGQNGH